MIAFTIIGQIVGGFLATAFGIVVWTIATNVFWGIVGAYRLRAIFSRHKIKERAPHWQTIKYGLRNWHGGNRLKPDGYGSYIQFGGIRLPIDGRDKIQRDRFYGG